MSFGFVLLVSLVLFFALSITGCAGLLFGNPFLIYGGFGLLALGVLVWVLWILSDESVKID